MFIKKGYQAFFLIFSCLSFATLLLGQSHTETGTNYGTQGVDIYSQTRHGPDGKLFLDPYFLPYLQEAEGQFLLDAGCGAGPWAVFAAEHGAIVYGIDIQESMIEKATLAAAEAGVEDRTTFTVGNVGDLPYADNFFDKAISLNVGCNLPALQPHIRELKRVIKKGGTALITAPSSFGVVFTDGKSAHEEVIEKVHQLLSEGFPLSIQGLDEIYRATFAYRKGNWRLVLNEEELFPCEDIWRKIPKMVVPNRYHSEQEYLSLFEAEGFLLKSILHPKFFSEQERVEYNLDQDYPLDSSYVSSSPFVIFVIEKS